MARPSSSGRPARSPFQNGILPGSPGAGRDQHAVVGDLLDPPRRGAEHEGLADAALEHHLLVELADARRARPGAEQEDAEQPAVGNRAAVGDRHALGAFARGDRAGDAIPGHARPQLGELVRRIASRQHVEHAVEDGAAQLRERRRAADRREQLVDVPVVHRRHRHDLLRDDVERVAGIARRLDRALVHRPRDRGAGDEIAAELREDDALADRVRLVAAAADALQAAGDRRRRFDLDDQIDRAHVDAELERRGRDQRAQGAGLQQVLDLDALRPRDRAVVRADQRLAGQLVQRAGQPLGQPPAVDEDQRRAVRADELEQPRVDRRPDRRPRVAHDAGPLGISAFGARSQLRHVLDRHFDGQLQRLLLAGVDDRDRPVADGALGGELVLDLGRRPAAAFARLAPSCRVADLRPPTPRRRETARPRRADAASPTGRCAAAALRRSPRSRSSDSARCAPRLVGTSAWISSMMIVSTERSASRAFEVSSR